MSVAALPPAIWQIYHTKTMHDLDFFSMTGCLDWSQQGNDNLVLEPLVQYLAKWPDEVIFTFEDKMAELLYQLDRQEIALRAYRAGSYFSDDDFLYARCVALVNGRAYYQKILDGRKKLNKDMEFEAVLYAPAKAWARKHKKDISEYPHFPGVSYETGSNQEYWNKETCWTEQTLPLGWRIALPAGWTVSEGENGETVCFSPDSELTVRITPFHAEKAGKPVQAKKMEQAYLQTIPPEAVQMKPGGYSLPGFRAKFFEAAEREGAVKMFHIYAGYYGKGELLSVNFYGREQAACRGALKILDTLSLQRSQG